MIWENKRSEPEPGRHRSLSELRRESGRQKRPRSSGQRDDKRTGEWALGIQGRKDTGESGVDITRHGGEDRLDEDYSEVTKSGNGDLRGQSRKL